jgi:hypothetical protein
MGMAKAMVSCKIKQLNAILLVMALCGASPGFGQQRNVPAPADATSSGLPNVPKPMANASTSSGLVSNEPKTDISSSMQQPTEAELSGYEDSGQKQPSQKPVGTAAAPPEGAAGVTASRPAGAVIAPAKQRRARAILIRVGLLVGAGVAIGTVIALTRATPNQPPQ